MEKRQRARLETLVRIAAFLDDYVIELGHLNRSRSSATLSELLRELAANRDTQATAVAERRSCTMRRRELRLELRTRHLRPIAAISRVEPAHVSAAAAMRCPSMKLRDELFLAEAESMGQHAARRWLTFRRHRLPRDFVQQLRVTIDAIDGMISQSEECRKQRKAATAALASAFRRVTRVVAVIDALVESKAHGNRALLEAWHSVRRPQAVRAVPDQAVADAA
jgi:hypothetical protein